MNRRILLFLFLCFGELKGCHDKGKERNMGGGNGGPPDRRVKRRTDNLRDEEVGNTNYVRDFFSNCLRNKVGNIWNWTSVVDVSVLDSQWYRNSDLSNCSVEDSVLCWQLRLNAYLKQTSPLLQETRDCMVDYNVNITDSEEPQRARRVTRQTTSQVRCTDFYANSPKVREYENCNKDNVALSPAREEIDFPSVIQFVAENTICGPEFPDCGENGEETITQGDPTVPSWPYRFEALMRKDSPVRDSVLKCNNLVYPSYDRTGAKWGKWGPWSQCPACGTYRFQERTRVCENGISCPGKHTEERACKRDEAVGDSYFGFTATSSPGLQGSRSWTFGGEPGYPGSRGTSSCSSLIRRPCLLRGKADECNCQRFRCCWHATTRSCFKPTYTVTKLRTKCPPGFKNNPPRCDPIIVCDSNPCLNGGTCINKINGFECQCPPTVTGDVCENLCGNPPSSLNVIYDPVKATYKLGDMVTYTCSGSTTIQGSVSNQCTLSPTNSGDWTNPSPICAPGCSTPPGTSPQLSYNPVQTVYGVGQFVTYSCIPASLTLVGQHILTCRSDGLWNPPSPPICSSAVCDPVPPITVGLGLFSPTTPINLPIGQIVTYTCSPGYFLVGSTTIQCLTGPMWSGTAPQCQRACDVPPAPIVFGGGTVTVLSTSPSAPYQPGTQAIYGCSMVGYQIPGDSILLCQSDGTWNPTDAPRCQKDCLNLPIPTMGLALPPGTSHPPGTLITYSCNAGYLLSGPTNNLCQGNLNWTNDAPECKQECSAPPGDGTADPTHVTSLNYVEGDTVTYVCALGNPVGPDINLCSGGTWSISEPTCGLTNCPPLPTITANGFNVPTGVTFNGGQTVTYQCSSGYVLVGPSTNECQTGSLTWTNAAPTCALDCGTPPTVQFASFSGFPGVGQTITYVCDVGYNLIGSSSNMCIDVAGTATWTVDAPNLPTCVQGCGAPPSGPEVSYVLDKTAYLIGETVSYSCVAGKNVVGAIDNQCIAINTWINTISPTCSATVCPPTPSLTDGSLFPSTNLAVGQSATFSCNSGFTFTGSVTVSCINGIPMPELVYSTTGVPPSCTAYCDFLPAFPPHATPASPTLNPATASGPYQHGTVATYECNPNYIGVNLIQSCDFPNFQFTPLPGPDCLLGCPGPVPIKPKVGFTGISLPFKEGDVATYACAVVPGQIVGPYLTNRCTGGVWEVSLADSPECLSVCVNPPVVDNGTPLTVQATYAIGERVFYTCNLPNILVESSFAECQPDLTWTSPGICSLSCGSLPFGGLSLVIGNPPPPYVVGNVVNYGCVSSTLTRHSQITDSNECLPGGIWRYPLDSQAGVCEEVCTSPPQAPNGFHLPLQLTYTTRTVITYNCFVNYHLTAVTTSMCQAGSPPFWSNTAVNNCRRICLDPAVGAHVTIVGAPPYVENMLVIFSCSNPTFPILLGATNALCKSDGQWDYQGGIGFPLCTS